MSSRNRETSYYKITKARHSRNGAPVELKLIGYVQGQVRADHLVDIHERKLSEEEKQDGIFITYDYAQRDIALAWINANKPSSPHSARGREVGTVGDDVGSR